MQELLCAADILITDYSSSMWDFSLTFKPCFIYAPDLAKYQAEQGFYIPLEQLPFPIAETNEQLAHNIRTFDPEKYKQAVKQYHSDLGSHETGTAREQFCKILLDNEWTSRCQH
jgi:CDP-glycerol glycerophosphotransferase